MAYSEAPVLITVKAATTFTSTSLYRPAYWATSGGVSVGDPGSTSVAAKPAGIAYSFTKTTSTDAEAISLAVGGVVKVKCAATTVTVNELIAYSSDGWGCTPTTNHWVLGRVLEGSSGGAGHVKTVLMFQTPLNYTARLAGTT